MFVHYESLGAVLLEAGWSSLRLRQGQANRHGGGRPARQVLKDIVQHRLTAGGCCAGRAVGNAQAQMHHARGQLQHD